jgi:hypothetical protein
MNMKRLRQFGACLVTLAFFGQLFRFYAKANSIEIELAGVFVIGNIFCFLSAFVRERKANSNFHGVMDVYISGLLFMIYLLSVIVRER